MYLGRAAISFFVKFRSYALNVHSLTCKSIWRKIWRPLNDMKCYVWVKCKRVGGDLSFSSGDNLKCSPECGPGKPCSVCMVTCEIYPLQFPPGLTETHIHSQIKTQNIPEIKAKGIIHFPLKVV